MNTTAPRIGCLPGAKGPMATLPLLGPDFQVSMMVSNGSPVTTSDAVTATGPSLDLDELRVVLAGQGDPGGAMGLVADDQVGAGHAHGLGGGDDVDRLVGGEHHHQRLVPLIGGADLGHS